MKTNQNFTIIYILLALAQMVICNYCRISPFIYVTILPAMVLALPQKINTALSMVIAFITGLAVDFLSEGIIGLNTLSLVPVAFIRHPLLQMATGEENSGKDSPFGLKSAGIGKVLVTVIVAYAVFLSVSVMADSAGVRPLWFNAARFGASLVADSLLALLVIHVLTTKDR